MWFLYRCYRYFYPKRELWNMLDAQRPYIVELALKKQRCNDGTAVHFPPVLTPPGHIYRQQYFRKLFSPLTKSGYIHSTSVISAKIYLPSHMGTRAESSISTLTPSSNTICQSFLLIPSHLVTHTCNKIFEVCLHRRYRQVTPLANHFCSCHLRRPI